MDNLKLIAALLVITLSALIVSATIAGGIIMLQDAVDRDHCFASAGRVEHYDADRPQVWRCVGARAEGE